jgi:hypothetical protein
MLIEVQEDLEHSQRSQGIHKFSKFDHLKSSQKQNQCVELVTNFPMVQMESQTKFICKSYKRSKFGSNMQSQRSKRKKEVTHVTTARVTCL